MNEMEAKLEMGGLCAQATGSPPPFIDLIIAIQIITNKQLKIFS